MNLTSLKSRLLTLALLALSFALMLFSCKDEKAIVEERCLDVVATAYNNVSWQTKAINPSIAAWGDTLKKGMKVIAVSRDLIDSGLTHNMAVYIPLLNDTFLVKDKMNRRWRKRIDIFMDKDIQKARNWGKQKLAIRWIPIQKEKEL